jgi:hypothetical protein
MILKNKKMQHYSPGGSIKNLFFILSFSIIMAAAGCQSARPVINIPPGSLIVRLWSTGNAYNNTMEVIHRQARIRNARVINETNFFGGYYQQMEFEIDLLNPEQLASLQMDLLRIPGVIRVNILLNTEAKIFFYKSRWNTYKEQLS